LFLTLFFSAILLTSEETERMELRDKILYQIFVRDYSEEGNIQGLIKNLDTLLSTGGDIFYLMPIQPIGKEGRKGTYGSPYSIADYEKIDPLNGSEEDLMEFTSLLHAKGKKVILDMVFNHTSKDSKLVKEHPDWFYQKDGRPFNRIEDWSDVADLNHSVKGVDEYLIDKVLKKYVSLGIDGFRFDVTSLIPPSFFKKAKEELGKDCLFLGEVVDTKFLNYLRAVGIPSYSNGEYAASGMELFYPYASWGWLQDYLEGRSDSLAPYEAAFSLEEASLPYDCLVTRAIENHDRKRIASYSKEESFTRSLLAFSFFTKGPAFVYNGEERKAVHHPDIFEKETIPQEVLDKDYYDFYQKLVSLKHREKNTSLRYSEIISTTDNVLLVKNTFENNKVEYGVFNLSRKHELPYTLPCKGKDLLSNREVKEEVLLSSPLWIEAE